MSPLDVPLGNFLTLAAVLFAIGFYGVLARRSAIQILMAVELMLAAVTINLVAFSAYRDQDQFTGIVFAIFVITVAAAEVALALGIVLRIFRERGSANVDEADTLKW